MKRRLGITAFVVGLIALAVILTATNPSESDMLKRTTGDGWVQSHRTNLFVCSISRVTGLTGAKGTYLGIAGQVFRTSG